VAGFDNKTSEWRGVGYEGDHHVGESAASEMHKYVWVFLRCAEPTKDVAWTCMDKYTGVGIWRQREPGSALLPRIVRLAAAGRR